MAKRSKKKIAKDKAWKAMSEYVRRSEANKDGYVACVTCGIVKYWKGDGMHAGHFVPQAQGDAARFELDNIHTQCYRCNVNLGGNGAEYTPWMIAKYGQERVDEIRQLAGKVVKYTEEDYNDMENLYIELFKNLKV